MGNCIGKKSNAQNKHRKRISSKVSTCKFNSNNPLNISLTVPLSSEQTSNHLIHLSNIIESHIKSETRNTQSHSSLTPTITNDPTLCAQTPSILSCDQSSLQYRPFKSNTNVIDLSETNAEHLITSEQTTVMGSFCSKDKGLNRNQDVQIFSQEITSESVGISPSPTLSDSSLSSYSCNSTSLYSQDQLILSSSCSSTEANPTQVFHFLPCNDQVCDDNQSTNETLSIVLPASISRYKNDLFLYEFHQNAISHNCATLNSIIDDVSQHEFIRIHQRTKTTLIENKQYECINLKDLSKFDSPSLIFDEDKQLVYVTKHCRPNELDSIVYNCNDVQRSFSSCDNCSSLLSGSKFNHRLHTFLIVNSTYNLVQMCFNELNNNNIFGYISQKDPHRIQQTTINSSKLNYSYDIDIDHMLYYVVLRIRSWPIELRSVYRQRKRSWPSNVEHLFADNTCFIRFTGNEQDKSTNDKCPTCQRTLVSLSNASWSYIYAAVEDRLVRMMSDGHVRFASILWNYLNGKTQGQLPFNIFKHTLFYFFEQYTVDSFMTSDFIGYIRRFIDYLRKRIEMKFIPNYFNSQYNLYNEPICTTLINLLSSTKINYLDLKTFSFYISSKSSLYLYHLIYLIQMQSNFLQCLRSSKTNLIQTIVDTHKTVVQHLSTGVNVSKRRLDSEIIVDSIRPLTLDCLYRYQEENVQTILDYLPLLREQEPSLLVHSLWSVFIQYFNSLFDDLFIPSSKTHQ